MKSFWIVVAFFLIGTAKAQTITISDVKVSVKGDSAAAAREEALEQAHQVAFKKLMNETLPEGNIPLPSQDVLKDMVSDFSIDREKSTPTSYTASMTFQFDELQVTRWVEGLQQGRPDSSPFPERPSEERGPLKVTASYATYGDWQHIKKALEDFPGVQHFSIFALSPKNANLEIVYRGPIDQLERGLLQKGILLSQQGEGWVVSSTDQALHADVVID